MNGDQFHSSLFIAGNCLGLASEDIVGACEQIHSAQTKNQLRHAKESIDNCAVIIESLKHYLDEHPLSRESFLPFRHSL